MLPTTETLQDHQFKEACHALAALNMEQYVDELFQPILKPLPKSASQEVPLAAPPPEAQFEVVVQSLLPPRASQPNKEWKSNAQVTLTEREPLPPDPRSTPSLFAQEVQPRVLRKAEATGIVKKLPEQARAELVELRSEIMQAVNTKQQQSFMVCGVEADAGVSQIAAHLSRLLAEFVHLNVAMLSIASTRKTGKHRAQRTVGNAPVHLLLRRTDMANLAEITSSTGTLTLTELLCACDPRSLLQKLKQEFDLILIEAPAIARFSEMSLLAALMDGVILVAEPNVTSRRRMDQAYRRLREARANVMGMAFYRRQRR